MTWIDIIFIALIILFAVIGLWKGLLDSILGLITSFASIFIAIWAAKPVAKFIRKIVDVDSLFYNLLEGFYKGSEVKTIFGVSLTREKLSAFLTVAACAVLVFILLRLTVWLISKLFDSATASSSTLSGLNRLFGLCFGVVKGLLINCVILAGVSVLANTGIAPNLKATVNDSKISNFFYKYTSNFVHEKLSGGKLQSIVDDMAIVEREDKVTAAIKIDEEHWQIKNEYFSANGEQQFNLDKYGSYILYYDVDGNKDAVVLTSSNISIDYYNEQNTKISQNEAFTLSEGDSKSVKVKIIYYPTETNYYSLEFSFTLIKSE